MDIQIINTLVDKRMDCISILFVTDTKSYIKFIEKIFLDKGGIEGQRAPLQSKSAIEIRKRLVKDIGMGAVIPPMVLGLLLDSDQVQEVQDNPELIKIRLEDSGLDYSNISLIDGMQRTAALKDALIENPELTTPIRIEVWVARNVNNLIYRMLVLNTAQIPWSVKRQLEVVYGSLSKSIKEKITEIELFQEDDKSRRSGSGQYQASHVVELFIGFSLRKIQIELRDSITEEFSRLGIIDSTSSTDFSNTFINALHYLLKLDQQFERGQFVDCQIQLKKFKKGLDIFSSQPARIGFITAISQKIYGRPGIKYDPEKIAGLTEKTFRALDIFIDKLSSMESQELCTFIDIPSLDERINIPSGKVGEFERSYFLKVFYEFLELLLSEEELVNLTPVWLAYH